MKKTRSIKEEYTVCDLCGKEKTSYSTSSVGEGELWFCSTICHSYYEYPTKEDFLKYKAEVYKPTRTIKEFEKDKQTSPAISGGLR